MNSGVIFLCVVALSPLCPVLAPFAMMYFFFLYPLLKWGHIFVYRPTFDAGGMRWPLLHNILMNSIIVSQVRMAHAEIKRCHQLFSFFQILNMFSVVIIISSSRLGSPFTELLAKEGISSCHHCLDFDHFHFTIQISLQRNVCAKLPRCCIVANKRT